MPAAGPDRPRQTIGGVDASEQSDLRHPQMHGTGLVQRSSGSNPIEAD